MDIQKVLDKTFNDEKYKVIKLEFISELDDIFFQEDIIKCDKVKKNDWIIIANNFFFGDVNYFLTRVKNVKNTIITTRSNDFVMHSEKGSILDGVELDWNVKRTSREQRLRFIPVDEEALFWIMRCQLEKYCNDLSLCSVEDLIKIYKMSECDGRYKDRKLSSLKKRELIKKVIDYI